MCDVSNIKISAIICTLNRVDYLAKSLQSLINQTLHPSFYEIIVVDNGSFDTSKELVDTISCKFPEINICYIYEPVMGLSNARNSACLVARGEYVAFLDDDAIASTRWLESTLSTFKDTIPKPACVGGKIDLIWEKEKPKWLSDNLLSCLGKLNLSSTPRFLNAGEHVFGGNIAINLSILKAVGMFDINLGRKGNNLMSNEETFLQDKLRNLGNMLFYDPNLLVFHHARKECLSRTWYLKRYYFQGVSFAICNKTILYADAPAVSVFSKLIYNVLKKVFLCSLYDNNYFNKILELVYHIGIFKGCFLLAKGRQLSV